MIVKFSPNKILLSCPPHGGCIYYKQENEREFKQIAVTYEQLKLFLETYGYETDNIIELSNFGVDTTKIKHNQNLK